MDLLLFLTTLMAPAYRIRFSLFGLPANSLLLWIFFVWVAFSFYLFQTKRVPVFLKSIWSLPLAIKLAAGLFLLAGLIGLRPSGASMEAFGLYLVWFVQPISIFLMAHFLFEDKPQNRESVVFGLYVMMAALGILSLIQFFTLKYLPEAYWGNSLEPKRAVGLFIHPNFLALYVSPILAFLLPDIRKKLSTVRASVLQWWPIAAWLLGAVALLLSLSRAGWLGLAVAVAVAVIWFGDKKIRVAAGGLLLIGITLVAINTNLRYRLLLPFKGEKSAVSRVSLWNTGIKAVKAAPFLGLGLGGFGEHWSEFNTDPNLDSHNFPHNVFLNFWVETGLLGLIGFILIAGFGVIRGFKNKLNVYAVGLLLFFIALLVQGLIDNPYFKNDLAMMFWLLLALGI